MKQRSRGRHPWSDLLPVDVGGFDVLAELALDLRWSWNHAADNLWRRMDPELWELTHNPWTVLQSASRDRIEALMNEQEFADEVTELVEARRDAASRPAWFQQAFPDTALSGVAYFSMEFMLSEALPIYSGGLGNVAGDQLKAASDLGVPVIGIGLLYSQGYFRQLIDDEGNQQAVYPYNDPGQLPITPLRRDNGEWLRFQLDLPGYPIWVRAWQADVGRVRLYLLDTNDAANYPPWRGITSELYGGNPDMRLMQELVLGIGGWRLLASLGIAPQVCHLNEGHAAFAVLERARCFMESTGQTFEAALAVTRAGNLFTTHTAVAAGFDRFSTDLIGHYLGAYADRDLGISFEQLLALGRQNPGDSTEDFNMAWLAIHGSRAVNAVSLLHGRVSRHLFAPLFPRWPIDEVPVRSVTNGVHAPSWDSAAADRLWTEHCGKDRWCGTTEDLGDVIAAIPDRDLWQFRADASNALVDYVRERLAGQLAAAGAAVEKVKEARQLLDPNVLTLGFARRFATYKRPNLLLHDPERLLRLLTDAGRPLQIIIAGKAHPADQAGQAMIEEWIDFIRRSPARRHAVFLSDYDMLTTERLVQGVDIWLNTPRRPWEACGTSGMKVLVNGGINISELDGWWAEAYEPEFGWALGDGLEHNDDPNWDATEAEALYTLLEREVIPEFYTRDDDGIPVGWVARMRRSMAQLTPRFSTNRSVRQYTEEYYVPAADAYLERTRDKGKPGADLADWQHKLRDHWSGVHFGDVSVKTANGKHEFRVAIDLGELAPEDVRLEMYAEARATGDGVCQKMTHASGPAADNPRHVYMTTLPAARPADEFTPRVVPHHPGANIPIEAPFITWQR